MSISAEPGVLARTALTLTLPLAVVPGAFAMIKVAEYGIWCLQFRRRGCTTFTLRVCSIFRVVSRYLNASIVFYRGSMLKLDGKHPPPFARQVRILKYGRARTLCANVACAVHPGCCACRDRWIANVLQLAVVLTQPMLEETSKGLIWLGLYVIRAPALFPCLTC